MDLSTTYMGLKLANPLVPSASPLTMDLDTLRKLEDAGASAEKLLDIFFRHGVFGGVDDLYASQANAVFDSFGLDPLAGTQQDYMGVAQASYLLCGLEDSDVLTFWKNDAFAGLDCPCRNFL